MRHRDRRPAQRPGPKGTRYFYAYSDAMLNDRLEEGLCRVGEEFGCATRAYVEGNVTTVVGEWNRKTAPGEVWLMNFPYTSGDARAEYGVVIGQPRELRHALSVLQPPVRKTRWEPRQLNPEEERLAVLQGWESRRAADLDSILNGAVVLPYRRPRELPALETNFGTTTDSKRILSKVVQYDLGKGLNRVVYAGITQQLLIHLLQLTPQTGLSQPQALAGLPSPA